MSVDTGNRRRRIPFYVCPHGPSACKTRRKSPAGASERSSAILGCQNPVRRTDSLCASHGRGVRRGACSALLRSPELVRAWRGPTLNQPERPPPYCSTEGWANKTVKVSARSRIESIKFTSAIGSKQ